MEIAVLELRIVMVSTCQKTEFWKRRKSKISSRKPSIYKDPTRVIFNNIFYAHKFGKTRNIMPRAEGKI